MEKPIAFASRTLQRPERNYETTKKELLAVVYGLKQFRQYLLGRPIIIRVDHAALSWLKRTAEPQPQLARWLTLIECFDYTIVHRAGKKHANADALSRRPAPSHRPTMKPIWTSRILPRQSERLPRPTRTLRPLLPSSSQLLATRLHRRSRVQLLPCQTQRRSRRRRLLLKRQHRRSMDRHNLNGEANVNASRPTRPLKR